uniref:Heat shock protein 70 n=1 Tax=Panagrolaimus sp. ES5 TaxID=591445 RepID=A0AC34F3B1_9BILA
MAFHVGIYPSFGNVATYDTVTESVKYTNVIEVYQNETDKVKHMFKEITSKNSSKFESVCICLEADYGNEIRKKFIDTAKIFGFKNVEIIDWRTAVYLNAISQSNYKLKNYDIIWIFTGYSYHVWQYKNQKVKHIFSPKECQTKIDDFGIIKTKSKLNKDPNLLLFKEEIEFDKTEFVQSFPKSECFIFKQESYAEGALVKARIMAKNDFIAEFFSVIICFDINGVYSIKLLPLDSNTLKSNHGRIPEKEILCIGVDFINGEIMIQDYFSQETSKKLLNKTSKVVNNIDQAFKELIKATSFLSQNYIVFHIDDECYNHVLMAYYAACHKYDLKRFGFISTQAAELLCIFKKHQIDDWISIIAVISDKIAKRKIYCQIWKRYGNTFRADKSYLRLSDPGADDENLQKLEKESDGLIGVDLTFIDSIIDERIFERNAAGTKYETEFHAPAIGNWNLILHCNLSGIFYFGFEILVGIDLGTSRCCAAVNRKNGIQTVALDYTGERLLPSYVAYDEKSVKCGKTVVNRLRNHSKSTVFDSKRIIGRSINEIEIDENWDFSISEKEGRVFIEVETFNGKNVKSPEEVAADLLKHIKQRSAEFQGINLTKAVITVPAAFTDIQKSATLEAAKFAGWDEVILLPEPIAAAFAYYIGRPIKDNSYVFLFDLGGGTLDICIFKIANNQINIISNTGDSKLGGRDFDTVLINYFKNMLNANYGISAFIYRKYKLMLECQQIKEDLTYVYSTSLNVDEFESYQDGIISITREEFERMTIFLLNKIRNTILAALFKSNLKEKQIDKVLYVGGGSRMPMIRKLLKEVFPHAEQCCEEHPDEVVAIGAAYYAYSIFSE